MMKKLFASILLFVGVNLFAISVSVDKSEYKPYERVAVTLTQMPGDAGDWMGIFPKGSSNAWENVLAWKYDGEVFDGTYELDGVLKGEYEVRVFLNYSFTLVAKADFVVTEVVYNTSVTTTKDRFLPNEPISIILENMPGNSGDWVGIFPKNSSNAWANVLTWKYDGEVVDGTYELDSLLKGDYEVRVFLHYSYTLLAKKPFTVEDIVYDTVVTTTKDEFFAGEKIGITLTQMPGNSGDWVGIFAKDSSNAWENALAWKYDGEVVDGTYELDGMQEGEYEVRVFLNNTLNLLSSSSFIVIEQPIITTIKTNKDSYDNGEKITITFHNMLGNQRDWIGVFKVGDISSFENAYHFDWTYGVASSEIEFSGLQEGEYEVRAFFNNSFDEKAVYQFTVIEKLLSPIIFEDAEGGISDEWIHVLGSFSPRHDRRGTLVLTPEWIHNGGDSYTNKSEYHLPMHNSIHTILEMDMGGLENYLLPVYYGRENRRGNMPHFTVAVYVKTKKGKRVLAWDSFFNHENIPAFKVDYGGEHIWLYYPSPVEHVRGWQFDQKDVWRHFRVDLKRALKQLEPDNELIYVEKFMATGGFLDNIKLSSH